MSDIEEEDYLDSDSSDNEEQHSKLLNTLSQLDNTQRVKPATRKEISTEVSEYNLQKGSSNKNLVKVDELADTLKKKAKHVAISKKLKQVTGKSKTLPKPLEKTEEEKLKRIIGYENVRKQVKRWDAIVERNSLKDHLSFPLNKTSMKLQNSTDFLSNFKTKTPLEIEVEKILKQDEEPEIKKENRIEYPLTLEEMIEKRKEMARMRAKLSYKEAKAQRQKKIKSKKYHRILKHEKVKQQLKDFEVLQKTDPSKALEKLEELDKTRILERASLRHRNTGKWAKNMSVKAKYDVESRKILAEQLKISKEMTDKVKAIDSDNEEEKVTTDFKGKDDISKSLIVSKDNPWSLEVSKEVQDFVSGYKKFWDQKNKELNKSEINHETNNLSEAQEKTKELNDFPVSKKTNEDDVSNLNSVEKIKEIEDSEKIVTHSEEVSNSDIPNINNSNKLKVQDRKKENKEKKILKNGLKVQKENNEIKSTPISKATCEDTIITVRPTSGIWTVTTVVDSPEPLEPKLKTKRKSNKSLNCLFSDLEENLTMKAAKKAKTISKKLKREEMQALKEQKKAEKFEEKKLKLSLRGKDQNLMPDMDVGLLEGDVEEENQIVRDLNVNEPVNGESKTAPPEIDPKNFIQIKPKKLGVDIPEDATADDDAIDDDLNEAQKKMIEEAFGEDDVTAEFNKLKKKEKDEVKISTSLPGWGTWGGSGIKPKIRKKKRFITIKLPPRKDKKKIDMIINENENPNIKNHLVKNVPHPFTSAEAFESNLRAPVGREWIPESAHLRLIQKPVETKLGLIINPMSEDEIIKKKVYESPYKGKRKDKLNS